MPEANKPYHQHPYTKHREEQRSGVQDEFSQDPDRKPVPTCKEVVQKARMAQQWIYDPKDHEWYSPDEFDKAYGSILIGNVALLSRVVIKHPNEGIEAGFKVISKMQEKWNSLVQRVIKWGVKEGDNPKLRA